MILEPSDSTRKVGVEDAHIAPSDPRINAFVRLVYAIDGGNARDGISASRELRRLGYNVCLTTPRGQAVGS